MLDFHQTAILHIADVRHNEAIGWVNGYADVMWALDCVLKLVFLWLVCWVHDRVFLQGQGESFDHDAHQCHFCIVAFNCLAHFFSLSDIEFLMQIKMGNFIAFSHWFLHTFLEIAHFYHFLTVLFCRSRFGGFLLFLVLLFILLFIFNFWFFIWGGMS